MTKPFPTHYLICLSKPCRFGYYYCHFTDKKMPGYKTSSDLSKVACQQGLLILSLICFPPHTSAFLSVHPS